jgi:hypothetical protein
LIRIGNLFSTSLSSLAKPQLFCLAAILVTGSAQRALGYTCKGWTTDAVLEAPQSILWAGSKVVPSASFAKISIDETVREAKQCRASINAQVVKAVIFTSNDDRESTLDPQKIPGLGFSGWSIQYQRYTPQPMISVLIVGNQVVARRLNASGKVDSQVEGHLGSLLDIVLEPHIENRGGDPRGKAIFFERATLPLALGVAQNLAHQIASIVSFPNFSVLIRNDSWFIDDPAFPVAYRFDSMSKEDQPVKPPVPVTYPDGLKATCTIRQPEAMKCVVR